MSDYTLSESALRGLEQVLREAEFDQSIPERLLDNALDYLSIQGEISPDESRLKAEVEAMPTEERESLSRAISSALRRQ